MPAEFINLFKSSGV